MRALTLVFFSGRDASVFADPMHMPPVSGDGNRYVRVTFPSAR
jgi:hypothetical protein